MEFGRRAFLGSVAGMLATRGVDRRAAALAGLALAALAASAEVKPIAEPWLKPGETMVCFGDSITAGRYYVPILQAELAKRGIKVVNAGVSGDKTPMALTRIKEVADLRPDAVLFFFGANDAEIGRGRWRDEPIVEPKTYRDNLMWMVHYFRLRTSARKFSIVAPPCRCEGDGRGGFGDIYRDFQLAAREAADRTDAVLVPLDLEFRWIQQRELRDPNGLLLTRDGVHFSPYGSETAARTMLRHWKLDDPAK